MKPKYRINTDTKREYWNEDVRQQKKVLVTAIRGVSKMIKVRRNSLYFMADFLKDQLNCERIYQMSTVYTRGPVLMWELARLEQIREELRDCIRKIRVN